MNETITNMQANEQALPTEQVSSANNTIKMVENALKVLDILQGSKGRLGVNEIAKLCSLSPSTTFRILKTLTVNGWAFQFSDDRYLPGEKLTFSNEKTNFYLALSDVAWFVMKEYSEKYNRALNLMVRENDHCKIIQQTRSRNLVDYVCPIYSELPIYACACGKVLLSELPVSLVERIISSCRMVPLTERTVTDPDQFWKNIRETARNGFSIEHGESSENGSCIAVPVRDASGTIVAALSFTGFIGMSDPEHDLLDYLIPLKDASEQISKALYTTWGKDK